MGEREPHTSTSRSPRASILVVEDSSEMRRRVRSMVEAMGLFDEVHEAQDGYIAFKTLRKHSIDIVLCDLQMPECDGNMLLRLARNDERTRSIPFVMLTVDEEVGSRVKLLANGASDYVVKPPHPEELRARLQVHLGLRQAQQELQRKHEELLQVTRTDALTGVANGRYLEEVLRREFDRALRYRRPLSALMLEVDHFERLDDELGPRAGDHALASVGALLDEQVRSTDLVARHGGQGFVILMPETTPAHALAAAERLRSELERAPMRWQGRRLPITASIGVAGCPSVNVGGPTELLQRAGEALHCAKQAGRNRVTHALGLSCFGASSVVAAMQGARG